MFRHIMYLWGYKRTNMAGLFIGLTLGISLTTQAYSARRGLRTSIIFRQEFPPTPKMHCSCWFMAGGPLFKPACVSPVEGFCLLNIDGKWDNALIEMHSSTLSGTSYSLFGIVIVWSGWHPHQVATLSLGPLQLQAGHSGVFGCLPSPQLSTHEGCTLLAPDP